MKIFVFTIAFSPSVGGIERMAETLCTEFVALGHEVRLATMTYGNGEYSYPVIRRPRFAKFFSLLRWCDVHLQVNVTLKHAWARLIARRKTIYRYANAYQRDDGTRGLANHLKVAIARHSCGIANSYFTAGRVGASHVVLNGYDDSVFKSFRPWAERDSDLVFLGRLVSQKGCDTLLKALAILGTQGIRPSLTVIGSGPDLPLLESLTCLLQLCDQVNFVGLLKGSELAEELNRHKVIVVPSLYEEPFGIVALEGLACGCIPVVSDRGGLVEAIGRNGFCFPNGDEVALAAVLKEILQNSERARTCLEGVESHLEHCGAQSVAEQYIAIFREHTGAR